MTHRTKRILTLIMLLMLTVSLTAGCGALGMGGMLGCGGCGGEHGSSGGNEQPTVCEHVYGDWLVTLEPTCKSEGSRERVCTKCNEKQTQKLAKTAHDEVLISETPATCMGTGAREIHCRYCDEDFSEVTPALGHDYELKSETKATCTAAGERVYVCTHDKTHTYTEVLPATGHDFVFVSQKDPTCTKKGEIVYKCGNCQQKQTTAIDETGHDFGIDGKCKNCGLTSENHAHDYKPTVIAPTCFSVGYTYYECSCGLSYKADYVEQLAHRWNDGEVKTAATCTKDGLMQYSCVREGCTASYDEVIKAGHAWGETQTEPATCLYNGKIYKTCSSCGAEDVEVIPAGHKWQAVITVKAATCTEKGKERRTCSVCEETDDFETDALGHVYKNGVCERCGEKFIDNVTPNTEHPTYGMYFVIDDIRSAYGSETINEYGVLLYVNEDAVLDRVAVYLTQDGNMWRRCIACTGTNIKFAVYVPYLSYNENIYYTGLNNGGINTFALSKGADGIWRYSEYATIGVNLEDYKGNLLLSLYDIGEAGSKTKIFDDLSEMKAWLKGYDATHVHTAVTDEAVAATCTEGGYTAGSHCSVCGEVITAREHVPALGHAYGDWQITTAASCEKAGARKATCTRCGKTTTAEIPALGHDYAETERLAATCTSAGYIKYKCANKGCGKTREVTLPKGAHEYYVHARVDAGCEKAGSITYVCSVCNGQYTESIPAGTHSYALISEKQPTKLESGYKKYKCANCDKEYSVTLPMLSNKDGNVLLVQDRLPWDNDANATMLKKLADNGYIGGWNVITSSQITSIDLYNYDLIYIANDQTTLTYNKIKTASSVIEDFAEKGGAVIYGSCDRGWASGEITYELPGGVGKTNYYSNYNYIMDSLSPIVTAELTGGTALTNALLYSTYSSHTTFTNLPEGANIILIDGKGNPSLVEYDYGEGYVMLSGLTWEYTYVRNMVGSNSFAKSVYDDVIVYALSRVQSKCEHVLDNGYVYPASCGAQGYTLYTCAKCGRVFKRDIVPALTHSYGDWIIDKAASCKQEGSRHKKCANCGDEISEVIAKTDTHTPVTVKGYAATCTSSGLTDGTKCSVCGKVLSEQKQIAKLNHSYGAWKSNGNGTHTKTCSHDSTHAVTENCSGGAATCTEQATCSSCGKKYGSALGHDYGSYVYDNNATCEADGTETATCKNGCGQTQTRTKSGSALNHSYGAWITDVAATCVKKGSKHKVCQNAGCTHRVDEDIPATGVHNYVNGVCANAGCGATDPNYNAVGDTYTEEGNYIYFGSYPQTKVSDSSLISSLNSQSGSLPTSSQFNGWVNYEYYISSSNSTAFMWYKDITYGGEKYRGVYFTSYRPYYCSNSSSTSNTYQDDNGYTTGTRYWFKYEPIKWRVLTKQSGKAFLLCDIAIDSQEYYDNYNSRTINGSTVYANNYEYSNIRAWLNDNFYNTAFSSTQQALIQTTLVDNSASSTNPNNNATAFNSGNNTYACSNTNDKIFLLSEQEVTNSAYGFSASYSEYDTARQFKSTDYAKCQGCWASTSSSYLGNCYLWLRSPYYNYSYFARFVFHGGDAIDIYDRVDSASRGVLPALWLAM